MTGGAVVIRLAPMVAVATMGTPRVMIREYVTMEHLWTARHAARQCREREAQVLHQETPDTERRSYATTSIFFAAAFLEALVNEVVLDVIDQRPSTRTAGIPASSTPAFRTLWRRECNIRGGVLGKYQAALDAASKTRYTEACNPFKNAQLVVHLRNHFMHYKPEWRDADDEHHFERALKRANVVENQQRIAGHWFPNKALGAGLADWSCNVATRFADSWWKRIGLTGKFDASFNQLPPP